MTRSSASRHLQRAHERLAGGDPAGALDPLLAAWRATRAASIADVIDRVSDRLPLDPIEAPTVQERTARFLACAAERRAVDVGRLVATPWPMRWKSALPVLDALIAFPHDPRIAQALARLADAAPFDSTTSHRFWNPLIAYLGELRDARTLRTLERGREHGALNGYRIRGLDEAIRDVSEPRPPLDDAAQAALDAIAALFEADRAREATHARAEAELLDAIYADPDDDGARMVYADWLTERGDVRGELITLQLARHHGRADAAMRRREARLLHEHMQDWLGPLLHVVDHRRCVFERGFLAHALLGLSRTEQLVDEHRDPRWATVHTFDAGLMFGPPELLPTLLHLPGFRGVRRLRKVNAHVIAVLAEGPPLPKLVELTFRPPGLDEPDTLDTLRRIGESTAFPGLERLGVDGDLTRFEPILDGALARRVARLTLFDYQVPLGPLARLVEASGAAAREVCVAIDSWTFALRRDASGRFTRLHVSSESADDELPWPGRFEAVLASLGPSDLTELTVESSRAGGYRASTIRALETRLGRFDRLTTVTVPWERLRATPESVPVKLQLRNTGASDGDRLRALWTLTAEPPLALAFDAHAVNQVGHHPLGADGLAHATSLLARRGTRQLDLYRAAASDSCRLDLREDAVWITSAVDRGADFPERYVGWLARLLDVVRCASGEVAFTPPHHTYTSLAPFHRVRAWLWLLEPSFDRIVPFDELTRLAATPAFPWLRAAPIGRHLALVFGPSPDQPPPPPQLLAFDEAACALWRARGCPR